MDRKKVIKGLECCLREVERADRNPCFDCPYADCVIGNVCTDDLKTEALAMLKEQQPKMGHWFKKLSNYPSAIAMGGSRTSACDLCGGWGRKTFKYCPHCGAKMESR